MKKIVTVVSIALTLGATLAFAKTSDEKSAKEETSKSSQATSEQQQPGTSEMSESDQGSSVQQGSQQGAQQGAQLGEQRAKAKPEWRSESRSNENQMSGQAPGQAQEQAPGQAAEKTRSQTQGKVSGKTSEHRAAATPESCKDEAGTEFRRGEKGYDTCLKSLQKKHPEQSAGQTGGQVTEESTKTTESSEK